MSHATKGRKTIGHGICVKTLAGKVLSQNQNCIEICGQMIGEVCEKGCMLNLVIHPEAPAADEGISCVDGLMYEGHLIDAVLVNDGENLTTYLLDKEAIINRKLDLLEAYRLSKAERRVASLLLAGRTNREIAAALYISLSTVRTHLGNIYKKVPQELVQIVFRCRGVS